MLLKRGDLIQFNLCHYEDCDYEPDWAMGLVLGPHHERDYLMRVYWFDDFEETFESVETSGPEYRMFSPGSSVG